MYNNDQAAVFLKDLNGREYPAIATINRKKRVNGQREISLSFFYTEINKDFMDKIEMRWKVLFQDEWYTIIHPGYATEGDYFTVNVTAILSFFVDLNGYYLQNKADDISFTANNYFNQVFSGTPYSYVLVNNFAANTMNFQDNQSRTERFLYGVDRFGSEFKVRGNIVYLYNQIGSDKDVILHEDLNVNNVRIDVDASGFHTWVKGYGDLPDQEADQPEPEYQLEVDYKSPLIEKYGVIEGPALKNGNYKLADELRNAVKEQVENSYKISTEIETVDLTNNGYPEMIFEEGDRVFLYVNRVNLNQQVRVMEVDETFDWEGKILSSRYVVGNEGIASRYKTQQYATLQSFRDVLSGKRPLEYDWLPDAVRRASEIINGNEDSLFKYMINGIIGINQNNPNGFTRYNTDGIGFSRDAGKTYTVAMTYEGINADAVTTGALRTNNVTIVGRDNFFYWDGTALQAIDPNDLQKFVRLNSKGLYIAKGAFTIERPDGFKAINNGIIDMQHSINTAYPEYYEANISREGFWLTTTRDQYTTMGVFFMNHVSRYAVFSFFTNVDNSSATASIRIKDMVSGEYLGFGGGNSSGSSTVSVIQVDLGVPTGSRRQLAVELRTTVQDIKARARIFDRYLEG